MDGDIIDWDARQKKLKMKVDEYDSALARGKVPEYMHRLRLDPTIERIEVLQAILDALMERRRLLVIAGESSHEPFRVIEGQIAEMQAMMAEK